MRITALWWWIDRWRRSSAFMDMTLEEQGAYRNLLDEAALRGGPLPVDERILAKACGDALAWDRVKGRVLLRFHKTKDGYRNNTLDDVLSESKKRSEKQQRYRNATGNGAGNAVRNERGNNPRPPDPGPDLIPDPGPEPGVPRAPTVLAGTLPRDHLRHAWCSERGKCVPDFLHSEFCRSVDAADPTRAGQRLKAFYEAVERGWPAGPIGDDPVKLWRAEFAAKFPRVAPVVNAKTAATDAGLSAFVLKHQGKTS